MHKPWHDLPDELIFFVCERFMNDQGATNIKKWLEEEGFIVGREQIYGIVRRGIDLGYLKLCPPEDLKLTRRLHTVFPHAPADTQVLKVDPETAIEHLTMAAAEKALVLIEQLGRTRDRVHIGLGAGKTTERFAKNLALCLHSEPKVEIPKLVIHALSSGFSPREPTTAPVAFFSFFEWLKPNVEYVGMFSEPFVQWSQYEHVKNSPGVREAFDERDEVDIVVSSLSACIDEHGLFKQFLAMGSSNGVDELIEAGWVGDVQWRPYSPDGPITWEMDTRPVTLFELEDLVKLAGRADKHVILISGPCGDCGSDKSTALRPLLRHPGLRLMNHLVTDTATVGSLLAGKGSQER